MAPSVEAKPPGWVSTTTHGLSLSGPLSKSSSHVLGAQGGIAEIGVPGHEICLAVPGQRLGRAGMGQRIEQRASGRALVTVAPASARSPAVPLEVHEWCA